MSSLDRFVQWQNMYSVEPVVWTCWKCGSRTGNDKGFWANHEVENMPVGRAYIRVCPNCGAPTFFDARGNQTPGATYGEVLLHLPMGVHAIYEEARNCMSVSGYHAVAMLCRKLIMHVAVDQGADEGESFKSYVDHLEAIGVVPRPLKSFADHVRGIGNEANHEIRTVTREEAEEMVRFLEMVLRTTYEYPEMLNKRTPPTV